ncbi:MAG: amidase family protein, partial [Alphaproteobacteria bacterium]|nr:amidase family protein [Alphaproteobacteria bacterium]
MALVGLSLAEMRDGLAAGDMSATELVGAHVEATAAVAPLNAYVTITGEQALAAAEQADARRAAGVARPLDGVPVAIKDLYCTDGVATTAAPCCWRSGPPGTAHSQAQPPTHLLWFDEARSRRVLPRAVPHRTNGAGHTG